MLQSIEEFKADMIARDCSINTVKSYTSDLRKFMRWYFETTGEYPVMSLVGAIDIAEYKRYLLNKEQYPATINRAIISLSAYFAWAKLPDPTKEIKSLREMRKPPRILTRTEQQALMRAAQNAGSRDVAIITLLVHTGIRVSEAISLDIRDIYIRKRSGHLVVRHGKGNKRRVIPLNSTARNAVSEWIETRGAERGSLFPGRKGKDSRLTARAVEYMLQRLSQEARIDHVSPHMLRHTFCKSLIDAGEPLGAIALLAGHENLNTTARYTRPSKTDLEKGVQKIAWE